MWIFRELFRLLYQIVVATAIASAMAGLWALLSSGDLVHDLRLGYFLFGSLLLLCAGAGGSRTTVQGRIMGYTWFTGLRGYGVFSGGFRPRAGDPTVTATAVFVGSALALFALGAVV